MSEEELMTTKFNIKTKFLWHSTQIYCLSFDRKGKFIFTGGDDGALRVYSIAKDRLIKTLTDQKNDEFVTAVEDICRTIDFEKNTEANMESLLEQFAICDIAVNHENTLVSAGKHNGSILVWNLQTFDLIITFEEQMFPIRSVIFSPAIFEVNRKYLISTSEDGFIIFFVYDYKTLEFEPKSRERRSKYDGERAANICLDVTTGGLLIGLIHTFGAKPEISKPKSKKEPFIKSDVQSAIRLFSLSDESGLREEWKTTYPKSHSECVYSIRFSHNTFRFASACDKDSNAFIWTFDKSNKKWDSIIIGINNKGDSRKLLRGKSKKSMESVFVEEIVFSCDDKYMITVLTDISIKVWNSETGELIRHFEKYHSIKISVVDSHPTYGHIFVSAGYDSNIFIYDILKGTVLQQFDCSLNSQQIVGNSLEDDSSDRNRMKPLLLECSFSPDGQAIGVTDNLGNLTVLSLESRKESDSLDQLEEALLRMHSESDEENYLPLITASEENSQFIQNMFEYETELLKGIEKPSPSRHSQNREEKKIDLKSIEKIDFRKESNENTTNKVKSIPGPKSKTKTPNKNNKKTSTKKEVETTPEPKTKVDSPTEDLEKSEKTSKAKSSVGTKQTKFTKNAFKQIIDEIFENPSSRPFHINDEIQYPTYRKEISDADLCLTSIKEDMLLNNRYSFQKFNKDMNKVIENAKSFYKHNDEEVYEMALIFEKFYSEKMETQFGNNFKPPKIFESSDEDSSDEDSSHERPVPKIQKKSDSNKLNDSKIESNSSKLNKKDAEKTPKLNGKKTSEIKKSNDETIDSKNSSSNRKRVTIIDESSSDSESTPLKKTKTNKVSSLSSPINDKEKTRNQIIKESPEDENITTDTPNDITSEDDHLEDIHSIDSSNELIVDLGEKQIEEKEKRIAVKESVSNRETVLNGNPMNETSSVKRKKSPQLNNCLFCIFCDKIFWTLNETKYHYISHLCPLKCAKCDTLFISYDLYLSHDCGHPKTPNNIECCRQYSDSLNWIEKFIAFQQTEDIESFDTFSKNDKKCIVCEKVQKFRPESSLKTKSIKIKIDETIHLEKHLKYVPQFQCLFCLLNNDKYFYCNNSGEASKHLSEEHPTIPNNTSDSSLQYFDGSIPMLDEIILQFHS